MLKQIFLIAAIVTVASCGSIQAPPYDKSKEPENRVNYAGIEGVSQMLKDKDRAALKDKTQKCNEAKFSLVDAQASGESNTIQKAEELVAKLCE
ncbi:MAG: hypothetical protein ACJA0G_000695 [Kangiellaceae bacterium]|jgi:hypothetical protein